MDIDSLIVAGSVFDSVLEELVLVLVDLLALDTTKVDTKLESSMSLSSTPEMFFTMDYLVPCDGILASRLWVA